MDGITRTRYNAPGARVMGLTLEGKMAYLTKFQVQAGVTLQQSHYSEPHVWNKEAPAVKKMMRTPNTYGYFTATYTPDKTIIYRSFRYIYRFDADSPLNQFRDSSKNRLTVNTGRTSSISV